MKDHKLKPSRWPLRFFRWYCHPDYREDIEGDLMERFENKVEEKGIKAAKCGFTRDVLQLFRPGIIRSLEGNYTFNNYDMFKYNFIIATRNLLKHKFYALINVLGLAIGMISCLLIFLYVNHELSYDSFHTKKDRIYRVVTDIKTPTETINIGITSAPMPAYMKTDFPEVEDMVRLDDARFLIQQGDKTFQEDNGMFADASFFNIFTFPLMRGNPNTALVDPFSVVLTEGVAKRYFGNEDPMGQRLIMEGDYDLIVTGVMQDIPENSNFTFDLLVSLSTRLEKLTPQRAEQWGNFGYQSYVLLSEYANPSALEEKLPQFMEKYTGDMEIMQYSLFLEPLADVYLRSDRGGPKTGSLTNVIIFSIIAGFILLIACFNFMNLSTARATERAKEVGIRKVVGALRPQLILQFLSESTLLSGLALIIALLVSQLLLPAFNLLSGKEVALSVFQHTHHILMFCLIALVVGLLAGIYPAFVLSGFKSITTLKGRFSSSHRGLHLRKVLVVTQFTISIILIAGTVVVYKQLDYMRSQSLGFKKDQMLVIDFRGDDGIRRKIESFKQQLGNDPGVLSVSASSSVPGERNSGAYTEIENPSGDLQGSNLNLFYVDHDFLNQYEMDIVAGRGFSHDFPTDTSALIINEALAASYGYNFPEDAVGKRFEQWEVEGQIIGVVKDYHFKSLQEKIEPLTIRLEPNKAAKFISLHISSNDIAATVSNLEQKWKSLVPHRPFIYFFLDESFDTKYRAEERFGYLFICFATVAIFIACLGLLGLISYTVEQRTKEIGVRKVFGASRISIVQLLTQDVLMLVLIAFFIAIPIAWLSLSSWLQNFAYQTEINAWVFVLAGALVVVVTFITIGSKALKAALTNPASSLRSE